MACMDKKTLTERDICTKFIVPSLQKSGWDIQAQVREEYQFTGGQIQVRGKRVIRDTPKRADFLLFIKPNLPIAIIEAKDNNHTVGDGMQQGLQYARMLDVPFIYSTNGDGFLEHNCTVSAGTIEREISLDQFPSPEELFDKYKLWKNIDDQNEKIITQDYFYDLNGKSPRYFQQIAINRTVEAIAKGRDRILLVMATGTGKTYTAFQIIWRLWKSKQKKRILFLADRNILIDQTMVNDFKHFGDKMTKVKHRLVDKSYEVYLSLYQGISGNEEDKNIYKQFSPDFFDLIVVDECHRGSAAADSAWREVLEYFKSASQIGLTATPRETKEISNMDYFGEPVYVYSLKQGIDDGYLAPYKVIRVTLDKDAEGWRPEDGMIDKFGREVPDEIYNQRDFDRTIVIDERTEIVAKKVTEYLTSTDRYAKTIIFCQNIDHAERMRQALANLNSDLVSKHPRYIMRITGDNDVGKAELDNFIDPESRFPVIVTTSKLMTTGVDAQTCKVIVLDSNINSMTEFKQIIGRGTRVREDFQKLFFTIIDFRRVTELFADPDFDGMPVKVYEPKPDTPLSDPPDDIGPDQVKDGESEGGTVITDPPPPYTVDGGDDVGPPKVLKYYVQGVDVSVINERVQYLDQNGKLITESLKDYTKKNILKEYRSLDQFLQAWSKSTQKKVIIDELEQQGIFLDELEQAVGKNFDPFDLICHIAFDQKPLTRSERARKVSQSNYFDTYGEEAKQVLKALLDKYSDEGISSIEDMEILQVQPFNSFGTPVEIIGNYFGGRDQYLKAVRGMESRLYA
jgi:type I restriction enzyme R subunit